MKTIVSDIIGREKEINDLRVILEKSSVVMSSTRRMGKTMILTKMDETQHPGLKTMLCFIESVQSAEEFVTVLRENLVDQKLIDESGFKKMFQWMNTNLGSKDIGIFKTPDFSRHWKKILNLMLDDLVESQTVQVILMLDEFPKMLWTLIQNGNHQQAAEILDELRNIKEKHEKRSKLRFIYCGSIGMNMVINQMIKEHKYAGAPLNNMYHYIVHEMSKEDAIQLIRHLMKKSGIKLKDETVIHFAEATSCLPFFIDRITMQLKLSYDGNQITNEDIDRSIDQFISGRDNNNQFKHFTERIDTYYGTNEKKIAHELLRILSKSNSEISSDELMNNLKQKMEVDDYVISNILADMYENMYVDRKSNGDKTLYRFRYSLLKNWWKLNYA